MGMDLGPGHGTSGGGRTLPGTPPPRHHPTGSGNVGAAHPPHPAGEVCAGGQDMGGCWAHLGWRRGGVCATGRCVSRVCAPFSAAPFPAARAKNPTFLAGDHPTLWRTPRGREWHRPHEIRTIFSRERGGRVGPVPPFSCLCGGSGGEMDL